MTAAERQRRRRARSREENPSQKPGRPQSPWHKTTNYEELAGLFFGDGRQRSARRHQANRLFESFGRQALGISRDVPEWYVQENVARFKRLDKKGILEQFGRHAIWLIDHQGLSPEEAAAEWPRVGRRATQGERPQRVRRRRALSMAAEATR
jgi:hypothetical protein